MKNKLKLIGIIAFVMIIGFSFSACDNPLDGTKEEGNNNGSIGNNPVGGKTYYQYSSKIEFAANGSYTGYSARYGYGDYDLDAYGRYQWDTSETGTYTWNENTNTVTLRPGKFSGPDGKFLDKAGYKSAVTNMSNDNLVKQKEENGWTQEELDAYIKKSLASLGYSSLSQYIDVMVNEMFSDHPYTYSFSKDGKSLFMREHLPQPKGTDELANKTYNGRRWDSDQQKDVKDLNTEYVFSANKTYTRKYSYSGGYSTEEETGSYSYDSTRKLVYFNKIKYYGQTASEYYETVTVSSYDTNYFDTLDAYKASETNGWFRYNSDRYDPTQKLIGWFDDDMGGGGGGEKTITGISVTTQPTKTVYNIGETLSTAGMVVTATYSDETTAAVTTYTTSGFDSATAGEKTITVSYEGKTATFTVTVQNASVVNNPVSGKTFYINAYKTEFDASNGTYTGYNTRYNDVGPVLDANGKFQWDIAETGTYTWNEDAKIVTLKPGKRLSDDGQSLLDKAEYKIAFTAEFNTMFANWKEENGWTDEFIDEFIREQLAAAGYSSIEQYIDAIVNERFGDQPYTYSFSNDGKSLLMQEALPQSKGTDELADKTYNGMIRDDFDQQVKNPNDVYVFGADKTYTHTDTGFSEAGSYSYDSTKKIVYFNRVKYSGQTASEYYETVTIWGINAFINDDAYKAAETNEMFCYYSSQYDPIQKLIGWFD